MTTFSVPIFGAVFEVHFGVHFGLFLDSDLLVLRHFLDFEVPFWAFFRRVLDRTFGDDFDLFGTWLEDEPELVVRRR